MWHELPLTDAQDARITELMCITLMLDDVELAWADVLNAHISARLMDNSNKHRT